MTKLNNIKNQIEEKAKPNETDNTTNSSAPKEQHKSSDDDAIERVRKLMKETVDGLKSKS